jgi:hypothetical protein
MEALTESGVMTLNRMLLNWRLVLLRVLLK